MLFNSALFILFLFTTVLLNYLSPPRYRLHVLIFSSFIFIGYYNLESLYTEISITVFNFYISKKIQVQKAFYFLGLSVNIIAILLLNYLNAGMLFQFSSVSFDALGFIALLGLSFYSLQHIAYITDIYYQRIKPENSIAKYMLYATFFPKIVSGPVMLPHEFLSQVNGQRPSNTQIAVGLNFFLFGLFKKLVLADRLFPAVSAIFESNHHHIGLTTLLGVYLFTIQLYFDFSGYTDMALGIGKMLGFDLKNNFNIPFRSASVSEFWRRWHISLINWFTTYIYYPVVYSLRQYPQASVYTGILLTFIVSAVWHGIGFTFLLWAACHIFYIYAERILNTHFIPKSSFSKIKTLQLISIITVFNAVAFSNIFFRAHSAGQAFELIKNIFSDFVPNNWRAQLLAPFMGGGNPIDEFNALITLLLVTGFLMFEKTLERFYKTDKQPIFLLIICLVFIVVFGIFDTGQRFIYMQF